MNEQALLRIIDVNVNRASEGVRVCEDLCRFVYNHTELAARLKKVRHQIVEAASLHGPVELVDARDVARDNLKFVDEKREKERSSLLRVVQANIHRATEALRSLEEYTKVLAASGGKGSGLFQQVRFSLYAIEQELCALVRKRALLGRFESGIYALLDPEILDESAMLSITETLLEQGVGAIQVATRSLPAGRAYALVQKIAERVKRENVPLVIQGSAEIALAVRADGLCLAPEDMPLQDIARVLPPSMMVGAMKRDFSGGLLSEAEGADFLVVELFAPGSAYSREEELAFLRKHCDASDIPVIVYGNMLPADLELLHRIPITAVGIEATSCQQAELEAVCARLRIFIDQGKSEHESE